VLTAASGPLGAPVLAAQRTNELFQQTVHDGATGAEILEQRGILGLVRSEPATSSC